MARPYLRHTTAELADCAERDRAGVLAELEHRRSRAAKRLRALLEGDRSAPAAVAAPPTARGARRRAKAGRPRKNPPLRVLQARDKRAASEHICDACGAHIARGDPYFYLATTGPDGLQAQHLCIVGCPPRWALKASEGDTIDLEPVPF